MPKQDTVMLPHPAYFSTCLSSYLAILFTGMLLLITLSSNKYTGLDDTGWRQLEGNATASRTGTPPSMPSVQQSQSAVHITWEPFKVDHFKHI
jgi:hypothetical protein